MASPACSNAEQLPIDRAMQENVHNIMRGAHVHMAPILHQNMVHYMEIALLAADAIQSTDLSCRMRSSPVQVPDCLPAHPSFLLGCVSLLVRDFPRHDGASGLLQHQHVCTV